MKARGKLLSLTAGKTGAIATLHIALDPAGIEELTGQDITVEMKKFSQKRSLNANSYFHVLCSGIAEKLGLSLIEVKNQMIADYGQIDHDLGPVILRDGIDWKRLEALHLHPTTKTQIMADGRLYRCYLVMRGSHTYDTREMAHLIDGTQQEAQAQGVQTLAERELERIIQNWKGEPK